MARLIVVLKQAENLSLRVRVGRAESTTTVPTQALQGDKGSAASTSDHLSSRSSNQKLSDIQ